MVKFGDHWTVNGFGETSIDLEGIVIVLNGSQPLAIGILWYRTITQVYTACNFFLLTTEMAIFESGEDKEEHCRDKERRKMQKNCDDRSLSQPIVKTRPEYEWFKFVSWTYQILFEKTNNDSIISLIYYWLFIGEKIIMIREVRGIFDICHNMQLTLAQLEMFVQSTANILEHLPLNKRSKVTPGPDLLKYEHWTMPLVFTNEEGWIFRTKFRRRKMLARPSSAFMIILISWKFGWEILTIGQTM